MFLHELQGGRLATVKQHEDIVLSGLRYRDDFVGLENIVRQANGIVRRDETNPTPHVV
jgi:hypothetical protein